MQGDAFDARVKEERETREYERIAFIQSIFFSDIFAFQRSASGGAANECRINELLNNSVFGHGAPAIREEN